MSQVVLAILTKLDTAPPVLAAAERLSVLLGGARIEALVMRVPPISTILVTEEILTKEQEQQIRHDEAERAAALRQVFERWKTRHGGVNEPRWIDEEGVPDKLVKQWGQRADYIVIAQPSPHGGNTENEALHSALFESERPVLVMPAHADAEFGKRIAFAWRDDKFTLHAVMDALKCISQSAEMHVLMGHREASPSPPIPNVLSEHGIEVVSHELLIDHDPFGAQLLATAHELKVDLLVMGAFVHSSWRNMLFGGVTKYMLAHADIPIMMRH